MKMTYDETKNFISNQLLRNIMVDETADDSLFDEREKLIKTICKLSEIMFYETTIDLQTVESCKKFNIKKLSTDWFVVDNKHAQGRFINANAIFKKSFCKKYECHQVSYNFMLENSFDEMMLKSGTIEPYNNNEKFLHSICTFKHNDKEYVFDGAKFLIMEKEMYFSMFKFKELQSLTKKDILSDRVKLAKKEISPNGILKKGERYKLCTDYSRIIKRFKGMGFVIYLYNREAFMQNEKPLKEFEKENCLACALLNQKIEEIQSENKIG